MNRDLVYIPDVIETECFSCKKIFKLFSIQKTGMDFCKICNVNSRLVELLTLPIILKQIVFFAEKNNEKINDKLIIYVDDLIKKLQRANENIIY